ncbi:MAG: hypothetical protein FWE29_05855 [Defluviitaleaceae bacterium]|nr:hypothetical protein [Defluviitaleaceae bacterium]
MNKQSFTEKCKSVSRNAFLKIGHVEVGNILDDANYKGDTTIMPFTMRPAWAYEKPAPKRKGK